MKLRNLFLSAALLATMTATAKDDFTALEQQQISIATPGLFSQSNAFTVDFAGLRASDFSFPLPVGKAKLTRDNTVEITTQKGDAVKAMFAGTVRLSKHQQGYGNVIVVRHDNGLETVYANNAQNLVNVGDRVKAGQTVAIVGTDGGRTYCSFAIMVNGGRINPEMILNLKSHRLIRETILCRNAGNHVDMSVMSTGKQDKRELAGNNDKGRQNAGKQAVKGNDVFADGNKFTLNLANFNPGEWSYPLPDSKVISHYGGRNGRRHTGVDIKTKPNDEILAAFDGVVTMSQPYAAYGNCIRIKHDNGLETLYSHNSKNMVKVGDRVKAGQVIGLTGQTGRATTPHLHFECRINGRAFDPANIFDHLNHALKMEQVVFTKNGSSITIKADKNYMAKGK